MGHLRIQDDATEQDDVLRPPRDPEEAEEFGPEDQPGHHHCQVDHELSPLVSNCDEEPIDGTHWWYLKSSSMLNPLLVSGVGTGITGVKRTVTDIWDPTNR